MLRILHLSKEERAADRKDGYFLHGPEGTPATRLCSIRRLQLNYIEACVCVNRKP